MMIKQVLGSGFFMAALLVAGPSEAQHTASFEWAGGLGGGRFDDGKKIVSDAAGNTYSTGVFRDTVDFDPGPDVHSVIAPNGRAAATYILKLDGNGSFVWVKTFAASEGTGIALDGEGHLYVAGTFTGTVDFDPGSGTYDLTAAPDVNAYVLKLDTAGNFQWAVRNGVSEGAQVVVNSKIGVVFCGMGGNSISEADFGGDTLFKHGFQDMYVAGIDKSGNYLWSRNIGTPADAMGTYSSVTFASSTAIPVGCDTAGNVYVAGKFSHAMDFDPGEDSAVLIPMHEAIGSVFVLKLDAAGDFGWVTHFGANAFTEAASLVSTRGGTTYITGGYEGMMYFNDPGLGRTFEMESAGGRDGFIVKLHPSGELDWARQIGAGKYDDIMLAVLDGEEHLYLAGRYNDTVDFSPGSEGFKIFAASQTYFLAKLDSAGFTMGAYGFNGITPAGLSVDPSSNGIYVTGSYSATRDFNLGTGTHNMTSNGNADIYVLKLGQRCVAPERFYEQACGSHTLNGRSYTASGKYVQYFNTTSAGCDSFVFLNLEISHDRDTTLNISQCGTVHFGGQSYDSSGIYEQHLSTINGCDSLVILDLTITHNVESEDTVRGEACLAYDFEGTLYTESGLYEHAFPLAQGCDSVVLLDLTVYQVETGVAQDGRRLTAAAEGVLYQWIDCNSNNSAIAGTQGRVFTPNIDGSYAVVVTTPEGCADTSACYQVGTSGIWESVSDRTFSLYPNPAGDRVTLAADRAFELAAIRLSDLSGRVLKVWNGQSGTELHLDIQEAGTGLYFIEIADKHGTGRVRLLKGR